MNAGAVMNPEILTSQVDCEGQLYWRAVFEGFRAGDPVGYGDTRAEAITDLMAEAVKALLS